MRIACGSLSRICRRGGLSIQQAGKRPGTGLPLRTVGSLTVVRGESRPTKPFLRGSSKVEKDPERPYLEGMEIGGSSKEAGYRDEKHVQRSRVPCVDTHLWRSESMRDMMRAAAGAGSRGAVVAWEGSVGSRLRFSLESSPAPQVMISAGGRQVTDASLFVTRLQGLTSHLMVRSLTGDVCTRQLPQGRGVVAVGGGDGQHIRIALEEVGRWRTYVAS